VGFASGVIPPTWRLLYSVNPMVGVIDGFRWAVLSGTFRIYWPGLLLSLVVVVMLVTSGFRYFRAAERSLADVM
jgi:lipopolysaccharide transport system permease protein